MASLPPRCCASASPAITVQLLQIIGLLLAGGVLLLWVCWKMWRELQHISSSKIRRGFRGKQELRLQLPRSALQKTLGQAIWQITIADVSMSLDNVLAVAGAAREHPMILDIRLGTIHCPDGLRRQLHREPAAKAPLDRLCRPLIILYVAFDMCYRGVLEVWPDPQRSFAQRCRPTIKQGVNRHRRECPDSRQSNSRGMPWLRPF